MNKDTRFGLLVIGLPFLGLIYCGGMIVFMNISSFPREHPLLSGLGFFLVPLIIAASIWIRASAKAYTKK